MGFYRIKIRQSDKVFSEAIRERDGWKCQYKFKCAGVIDYRSNPGALSCSHFLKRRHESTRFDPENCDAACASCHMFVEDTVEGKQALEWWKLQQLGERRYKLLHIKAQTYKRRDDKLDLLVAKLFLKEIKQA